MKVNQHAQHSNGSSRFLLIDNVYLQIHSVFESKSTCTTFKWLFKVHALLQCVSSNTLLFLKVNQHVQQSNGYSRFMLFYCVYLQTYFLFESQRSRSKQCPSGAIYAQSLRGTRSGPVRLTLPTPPQDQVPGPPGHVDCEQTNGNVLLRRYLPNHLEDNSKQIYNSA